MSVFGLWDWLRGSSRKSPTTRLSAEEAIRIAREAAKDRSGSELLTMTTVVERDGLRVWIVGQAGKGYRIWVEIDDATGQVIRIGQGGVR